MNPGLFLLGLVGLILVGYLFYALASVFSCKHSWEFVDKTEFPAPIETAKKNGVDSDDLYSEDIPKMSMKTVVIVLRCPKCGDTKILRETH